MSDALSDTANASARTARDAAERTVRIPANLMALIRQSYDTREKVLDWMLAFGVAIALCWVFRDQLGQLIAPPLPDASDGPNAGRVDPMQPNQNVTDVGGRGPRPDLYTYNMPPARNLAYGIGPSGTPPPGNPSMPPYFPG